jgi:hypothetical protein
LTSPHHKSCFLLQPLCLRDLCYEKDVAYVWYHDKTDGREEREEGERGEKEEEKEEGERGETGERVLEGEKEEGERGGRGRKRRGKRRGKEEGKEEGERGGRREKEKEAYALHKNRLNERRSSTSASASLNDYTKVVSI